MTMPLSSIYSTVDDLRRFGVRRSGSSCVGLAFAFLSGSIVMSTRFRFVGVFAGDGDGRGCSCDCCGGGANGDISLK